MTAGPAKHLRAAKDRKYLILPVAQHPSTKTNQLPILSERLVSKPSTSCHMQVALLQRDGDAPRSAASQALVPAGRSTTSVLVASTP